MGSRDKQPHVSKTERREEGTGKMTWAFDFLEVGSCLTTFFLFFQEPGIGVLWRFHVEGFGFTNEGVKTERVGAVLGPIDRGIYRSAAFQYSGKPFSSSLCPWSLLPMEHWSFFEYSYPYLGPKYKKKEKNFANSFTFYTLISILAIDN